MATVPMTPGPTAPFAAGSVSLRLYPHDLPPDKTVAVMRAQAAHAASVGFDGIMTSEHHGGFAGYMPNPLQAAGWALESMGTGWAAPCPLLLPLRPTALVVEEVAWLAARFPGRVGLGVAAGSLDQDFAVMGLDKTDLARRYADALALAAGMLSGRDLGDLAGDPAVARCVAHPVPVLSAAMSATACMRAGALGVGLLLDSLTARSRCRDLVEVFRAHGGTAPVVLIRRVRVGSESDARHNQQVDVYRSYAADAAQAHWQGDELITGGPEEVAAQIVAARDGVGADAVNLRVHVPGVGPDEVAAQIDALGEVLTHLPR